MSSASTRTSSPRNNPVSTTTRDPSYRSRTALLSRRGNREAAALASSNVRPPPRVASLGLATDTDGRVGAHFLYCCAGDLIARARPGGTHPSPSLRRRHSLADARLSQLKATNITGATNGTSRYWGGLPTPNRRPLDHWALCRQG